MKTLLAFAAVPLALVVAPPAPAAASPGGPHTVLVSVATGGAQAGLVSQGPSISADGSVVAFTSEAPNLVPGDTNDVSDVFVRDLKTHVTQRVSIGSHGEQGGPHQFAYGPSVSADGRFVAFVSNAPNLVPGDTNGNADVFVRDLRRHTTERVSVTSGGGQAHGLYTTSPSISGDGRFVVWASDSSDLVAGDTDATNDVFLHDRRADRTTVVSVATGGGQQSGGRADDAAISANGRYVVFSSYAPNLVPGDTNGVSDVFVRDLQRRTTQRVSLTDDDGQAIGGNFHGNGVGSGGATISADGRVVVFSSYAANLVADPQLHQTDSYARDLRTGRTVRVAVGPGGTQGDVDGAFYARVSPDGRYVSFSDDSSNLVTGDTNGKRDVFLRDLRTGRIERVSLGAAGQADDRSDEAVPSWGAAHVAFTSVADNLVPGDTNGTGDVFVR